METAANGKYMRSYLNSPCRTISLFIFITIVTVSCHSEKVVTGKYVSKLYDQYFILKDNGKYREYMDFFGLKINNQRGHYIISHDTVYLVYKHHRQWWAQRDYLILNEAGGLLTHYNLDSGFLREYNIQR